MRWCREPTENRGIAYELNGAAQSVLTEFLVCSRAARRGVAVVGDHAVARNNRRRPVKLVTLRQKTRVLADDRSTAKG